MKNHTYGELCISIIMIVFDRITKWYAYTHLHTHRTINALLSFDPDLNQGVAWSLGASTDPYRFYILMVFIFLVIFNCIIAFYRRIALGEPANGLLFIIVGALSNYIDRFLYGGVIDWITVHYHNWYWPTFNIADIMICSGVMVLLYTEMKDEIKNSS